jgi:P-type Cu+ transporter
MAQKTLNLPVTGMSCANCSAGIDKALAGLEGIVEASANFASERVQVTFETDQVNLKTIVSKIEAWVFM